MIDKFLLDHLDEIEALCKQNNVEKLYVFGSIVDGRFQKGKSDIDMLVSYDKVVLTKKEISKSLLKLWIQLQSLLDCKVDLISDDKIKGDYFKKYLDLYKELIYEKGPDPNMQ